MSFGTKKGVIVKYHRQQTAAQSEKEIGMRAEIGPMTIDTMEVTRVIEEVLIGLDMIVTMMTEGVMHPIVMSVLIGEVMVQMQDTRAKSSTGREEDDMFHDVRIVFCCLSIC